MMGRLLLLLILAGLLRVFGDVSMPRPHHDARGLTHAVNTASRPEEHTGSVDSLELHTWGWQCRIAERHQPADEADTAPALGRRQADTQWEAAGARPFAVPSYRAEHIGRVGRKPGSNPDQTVPLLGAAFLLLASLRSPPPSSSPSIPYGFP